ncbi:transglutaminase TgpA family protein [Geminocystis sp. CENA526]|uniref:transglutaminase TgpA family protein n=1 Tax=Geminocystis sp. CENA526 TaxID=1355871 RepID=UPI003D6ECE10
MENSPQIPSFKAIIKQIESFPIPKTEESILLRILVQMMVIVGIVATDVAARSQFPMSVWAIPLSMLGGFISWRRRKLRNITLKFGLAIAMIVTLIVFLGNLVQSIFDNRLVLAEFLVQLQVLHSFDLPRRKDLGYSMIIGVILIGVAATLSQTLAFAPWLLLFLLIAIPTMVLDYRSRMGLKNWEVEYKNIQREKNTAKKKLWWENSVLSPKKLTTFVLIILMLGLSLFAIMPRYPGYKLQSFPVSAPDGLQQNFNPTEKDRGIVNPGYNRDGTVNNNLMGEGNGDGSGSGSSREDSYYGFNTTINQNLQGSSILRKKIVLRIRSQAPGFWRVLAFDHYTGQGWEISREDQTLDIQRNPWNYQFNLDVPFLQGDTHKIIQTYTVVSDLPNIIPVLKYPQYLYFPTQQLALDTEGSLRSPTGLIEGLTYTTVSRVPYRSQTALTQAGNNYPDSIIKYQLGIPEAIKDKVRQKAEELLAKSPNPLESNYAKALYLAQAIKQNYQIQEDFPLLNDDDDLTLAFLENGGGFPDHFATVYTMMLRSIDIPSRFVVGFGTGQFNPFTGYYVVHNTDAHALTEVYFPNYGWHYFDPLPGHEIIPPSFEDDNTFGVLGQLWNWVASWLPSPITAFITALFSKIFNTITGFFSASWLTRLWQFLTGSFVGILMGFLSLIILAFLSWLGWNFAQKLLYRLRLAKLNPLEKLYREMLDFLAEKGYKKSPAQTPLEYAHSLQEFVSVEQLEIIMLITNSYVQWRYGNIPANLDYLQSQFRLLNRSLVKVN